MWHDGPRLQQLYRELEKESFRLGDPGKGRSVWMTMGYILADRRTYAIGLHDTDILNYERGLLARLFYPVVHPALDYEFSKGYYARATDRFYGRVTRLFYTPLLRSLHENSGHNAFLIFWTASVMPCRANSPLLRPLPAAFASRPPGAWRYPC